jgi:competence protein ComEC
MFWKNRKIIFYIFLFLFLAAVLIWSFIFSQRPASVLNSLENGKTKVVFFDVGQGSSVFIVAPNGNQALIDGGPGSQVLGKLGGQMPFFDREIDVVILTHPDADHLNGLIEVLKNYQVNEVIDTCIEDSGNGYAEWKKLIEEKRIRHLCAKAGQKIKLADNAELDVLFPFVSLEGMKFSNTNDSSIVMEFVSDDSEILLTGDAEAKTEHQLLNSGVGLESQILQVGHHGSKSSSSQEFLEAVSPETAVIQVGANNRYSHPTAEVLERLKRIGAGIFRTDQNGDVEFLCGISGCVIIE